MLKKNILKKNWEFTSIIDSKKQFVNKFLILYYQPNNEYLKIGISVSKKFANAVLRNMYKRQTKNILKNLSNVDKNFWDKKFSVVLILRKEFLSLNFTDKTSVVKKIFEKL